MRAARRRGLRRSREVHKHAPVGRVLTPLRAALATLCVALAVVFAGASSASVVDRVQHEAQIAHEHGAHLAFTSPDPAGHDHDGGRHHDSAPDNGDHHTGPGHHHADAPAVTVDLFATSIAVATVAPLALRPAPAAAEKGVRPGGLERPPRRITTLV
jgi:hypothetical protein